MNPTTMTPPPLAPAKAPLGVHLLELRRRVIWCLIIFGGAFALSFIYAAEIFQFLAAPLHHQLATRGESSGLIYTALTEVFFTYVRIALYGATFLSFPFIAIQLWIFIAPGLYHREKKVMLPFLIATPILFVLGGAFAYYALFPLAWNFFLGFEAPQADAPIRLAAKVDSYLGISMQLIFAFSVTFLLPVAVALTHRAGIVSYQQLQRWRKFAVIGAFGLAALLTPPDVISQLLLAIPMILLYELALLFIRWTSLNSSLSSKNHD